MEHCRTIKHFVLFILAGLILACQEEQKVEPREYPLVVTRGVSNVDPSGAAFSAELLTARSNIIEYGFVWSRNPTPTLVDHRSFLTGIPEKDGYVFNINRALADSTTYYIRAFARTDQHLVYGNEVSFISQGSWPPKITNFDPKFGPNQTIVTITGENFSQSAMVRFGDIEVVVLEATENELLIQLPRFTEPGLVHISIEVEEMIATSEMQFDLYYPWQKKNDINFLPVASGASFSDQNNGYVVPIETDRILQYELEQDRWNNRIDLPENSGRYPLATNCSDRIFLYLSDNFWEYEISTDSWIEQATFPGSVSRRYGFIFSLEDKVYIGGSYQNKDLWEYDIQQNTWTKKAPFPGGWGHGNNVWGHFTFGLKGNGYLGIDRNNANSQVWKYDPNEDQWTLLGKIPSPAYKNWATYVIKDKGYLCLGQDPEHSNGYVSNQVWEFDPSSNLWLRLQDGPQAYAASASFVIKDKGYLVPIHTKFYKQTLDFYEFDPSKN